MYNRYTPSTCEAVIGCTDFLIVLGWPVGRAVAELKLAGTGHYTPSVQSLVRLGLQLCEVGTLERRIGVPLTHSVVYQSG